ncbi:MAG: Protein ApaG [Gammaproteobacteria bacterium]|nr:MAG: Protein ApaG [Gammaproteobacteria bacterium]|tara:strand:- start:604 stop:984 length:381 start_codon:yes stop_codon:yes gene_type:complete
MSKEDNNISISIDTTYLQQESDPENNKFYFLYTVSIVNKGNIGAKLLSRHWVIEDANGKIQNVKGEGVVGDQPYINPGDEYQYTSGTVLETSLGTMKGSYQMINDSENYFDAVIPEFILTIPRVIH